MGEGLPGDITLRYDWRRGDRERVADLHRRGYLDHDERFTTGHVDELARIVGGMIDEAGIADGGDHRVWFAERTGPEGGVETLGCVGLVRRGDRGQLRWLIVLPEARGLGLGRHLVGCVIERARALGLREVFLLTAPGLQESMSLYRAVGFETVREEPAALWHGDGIEIEMTRAL